ncbi:MAG: 1-phosphofructokinase family hexose kinase [Planctomycetes bacterium]|nr:1-phosphofructokinase family hexose kinase [Planctomycetota bacterium]MCC7171120.1 1-phosphofructokinase family hexose kinase [Planctomycetota bacterium]
MVKAACHSPRSMILTVTPNPCLHKTVSFKGSLDGRLVVRPVESWYQAGGKGINCARTIRALGGEVTALTTAGGHVGRLFLDGLAAEGIAVEAISVARPTRMSTFVYSADARQFREFLEPGLALEAREATALRQRFEQLAATAALITLNGSVPDRSLDEFHADAARSAKALGKRCLVDTYGPPCVRVADAKPWMLKANLDEARGSFHAEVSTDSEIAAFARSLRERGVEHVLLTAGARGAWLFSGDGAWFFTAPRIDELNPVGSGDAMLGAIAHELTRGSRLVDAVRIGIAAGAANAARLGVCDFGRSEVDALLPQIRVSSI